MSTIVALLEQSYRRHASKTALRHKSGGAWIETSYRQLWQDSDRLAAGMTRFGLQPGERAAILAPPSPGWLAAYFGTLKASGVVVPIDKELKAGEVRHILADCGARLLFTESTFLDLLAEVIEELPALEKIVLLDREPETSLPNGTDSAGELQREWRQLADRYGITAEETDRFARRLAALAGSMADHPSAGGDGTLVLPGEESHRSRQLAEHGLLGALAFAADDPLPSPPEDPSATAVILYTSGTTGRSKGAMLSHGNIVSNVRAGVEAFGVDASMTTLSFLPINHVYEQVCGILLPLSVGGTVSFAESIKRLGANLAEVRPSFLLGVPAVFRLLLDRIRRNLDEKPLARRLFAFPPTRPLVAAKIRRTLGEQTIFISGGAALDPEIARGMAEFGLQVFQGYGITETSPIIAVETPAARRIGTVGPPLPGVEVRIANPNEEGVGEILVRGPNVMRGYFNNPRATAEVLRDGWYATGDLGRLDGDGYLSICGRVKNLIVTPNGKNVYPEEVENELLHSPFIAEAMVYGHQVSPTAEEIHAMIYPDQEALDAHAQREGTAPLSERDVEELIRQEVLAVGRRLADYKRVRKFTLREDEFPKTTTRKIKRFEVGGGISAGE